MAKVGNTASRKREQRWNIISIDNDFRKFHYEWEWERSMESFISETMKFRNWRHPIKGVAYRYKRDRATHTLPSISILSDPSFGMLSTLMSVWSKQDSENTKIFPIASQFHDGWVVVESPESGLVCTRWSINIPVDNNLSDLHANTSQQRIWNIFLTCLALLVKEWCDLGTEKHCRALVEISRWIFVFISVPISDVRIHI